MLHNPNVKPDEHSVLEPYYLGSDTELPWPKIEEYAYQFYLDGEVFLPTDDEEMNRFMSFMQQPQWMFSEDDKCRILEDSEPGEDCIRYFTTDEGRALLDVIFEDYHRIFMD